MPIDLNSYGEAPFIVSPAAATARGVDYLGMAQDNFNLMDACMPGINNTTSHVRPYSLMCFAYWQFRNVWSRHRGKPDETDLRRFREKIESLFLWSHKLNRATRYMPGSDAKIPKANGRGEVALDFKAWNRNATSTSYMAAVQYRSSLTTGLNLLRHERKTIYKVTSEGEALAQALDSVLAGSEAYALICDPEASRATEEQAAATYRAWNLADTSPGEARLFQQSLFNDNATGAAKENAPPTVGATQCLHLPHSRMPAADAPQPRSRRVARHPRLPPFCQWFASAD